MMISAWWLMLICPVCAMVGFLWAALLASNAMAEANDSK